MLLKNNPAARIVLKGPVTLMAHDRLFLNNCLITMLAS